MIGVFTGHGIGRLTVGDFGADTGAGLGATAGAVISDDFGPWTGASASTGGIIVTGFGAMDDFGIDLPIPIGTLG